MRRPAAPESELQWGARALWTQLQPLLPGLAVEVVRTSASTNSDLLARARIVVPARGTESGAHAAIAGRRQADTQPCLLVAEHQLAGRGRLGRAWKSAPGASLTFSLALPLAPRDWSGLSLAVGVALAEALQALATAASPRVALKWPNDLWLQAGPAASGRKIGGVLIETLAAGTRRLAVIGVGINIAPLAAPFPADLAGQTGCLQEIAPQATAPATLAHIAPPLVQALQTFEREGFAAFAERFAALDALRGEPVVTSDARCPAGTARGVDGQGGLRIETADGMHVIHSGEVSVRPAGRALPAPAAS
ncbi:MAG: biotin--[acetyl-CoA-carboxylase] ligase [Ideonella sp.]|nr:biotin--[acetyl-CoA-carboxylase] ligase [Ideonella sp.]